MPIAGAAAGAGQALEKILAEQMLRAQQVQRDREAQQRLAMDQQRMDETIKQNEIANQRQVKIDDEHSADRRQKSNQMGVRRMIGDSLMQRTGPMTADDRRGLAALQVEAGDLPDMSLLTEPTPKRTVITTIGKRGEPVKKAVTDDELLQGVPEWHEPPKPTTGTTEQVWVKRGGKLIPIAKGTAQPGDEPYDEVAARQTQGAGVNTPKAAEVRQKIHDAALALKGAPGLGSMTGTHFNPSHLFGLTNEPVGGTEAADAKAQYDSLASLMTLENLGFLKGAMSDKDIEFIKSASTSLKPGMRDATFLKTLQDIINTTGGEPAQTQQATPDPKVLELIKKYGGGG